MGAVRVISLVTASAIALTGLTACNDAKNVHNGGPLIADTTWLLTSDPKAADQDNYLPAACKPQAAGVDGTEAMLNSWKGEDDYDKMQKCSDAMKQLIDVRFAHFEDALHAMVSNGNLAADTAVIGLSTAGGLLSGATAKILSLASAGVTGFKSKIDEDVLYNTSIEVIISQMHTNRATWASIIDNRMAKTKQAYDTGHPSTPAAGVAVGPAADGQNGGQSSDDNNAEPYNNMYEVANDLFSYDRAGSWTEALASLKTQTAAQAAACEAKRKAKKGGTDGAAETDANCPSIKSGKKQQKGDAPTPPSPDKDKKKHPAPKKDAAAAGNH